MLLRSLPLLALFVFVPALSAADKPKAPTLTLRLPALDDLIADLRYLAEQAGRGEEAKQFEKLVKSLSGEKGIEGLDPKKPLALDPDAGGPGVREWLAARHGRGGTGRPASPDASAHSAS